MTEVKIKDSNIKTIFYNEMAKELLVFFNSNHFYTYKQVEKETVVLWQKAKDKSKFFHENIKNEFEFEKKY